MNRRIADLVTQTRKALGLSQVDLSHLSGVSLPTIQNVETGRANPSVSTLLSLLGPLGFSVDFSRKQADWGTLAACGFPLSPSEPTKTRPDRELLIEHLRRAILYLDEADRSATAHSGQPPTARERESIHALLLALKAHFPTFYGKHFGKSPLVRRLVSGKLSGRVVKLKRLAERTLAEYL